MGIEKIYPMFTNRKQWETLKACGVSPSSADMAVILGTLRATWFSVFDEAHRNDYNSYPVWSLGALIGLFALCEVRDAEVFKFTLQYDGPFWVAGYKGNTWWICSVNESPVSACIDLIDSLYSNGYRHLIISTNQ